MLQKQLGSYCPSLQIFDASLKKKKKKKRQPFDADGVLGGDGDMPAASEPAELIDDGQDLDEQINDFKDKADGLLY